MEAHRLEGMLRVTALLTDICWELFSIHAFMQTAIQAHGITPQKQLLPFTATEVPSRQLLQRHVLKDWTASQSLRFSARVLDRAFLRRSAVFSFLLKRTLDNGSSASSSLPLR